MWQQQGPGFEVFQFVAATYVLRQNKCVHFEAPFTRQGTRSFGVNPA